MCAMWATLLFLVLLLPPTAMIRKFIFPFGGRYPSEPVSGESDRGGYVQLGTKRGKRGFSSDCSSDECCLPSESSARPFPSTAV